MTQLTARDAERLLGFVAEVESSGADQLFNPELLVNLGRLIPADWVWYSESDYVRRRGLMSVGREGDDYGDDGEDYDALYELIADEHPVCTRLYFGEHPALMLSDFMSLRELRGSRIYDLWFSLLGVERMLAVAIPSPMWHRKTLVFERGRSQDFTERDRAVLNHLRPHLEHLWQAARTRRLLTSALAELERADEHDPHGVIFLGVRKDVEFVSPAARRLMRDFFPVESGSDLPAALRGWLEAGSAPALIRRRGDRRLVAERAGDSIVLQEQIVEVELTAREREVLAWVARGKTNAEIAELLWLAPSTVRKHLENVYAKLGVSTRTAAVARFLRLVDAEAS